MDDITLVFNDEGDWMGVYRNGYLAYEGHSIEPEHLLRICGLVHRARHNIEMAGSHLPPLLSAVR